MNPLQSTRLYDSLAPQEVEMRERYRAFVLATSDLVYRMKADWSIILGVEGQNFVAQDQPADPDWFNKNVHPADRERVWAAIQEAIRTKGVFAMEHRVNRVDGTEGWTFSRAIPILHPSGEIKEWFGVARDTTESKRAQEKILASEARLRFMAESMPQKIFTTTPSGDADYHNAQWMEFTGLSSDAISRWGWAQFIHPDDLEGTMRIWRDALTTGKDFQIEQRFRRHDGVYRWHLSRARPMRDSEGQIVMWIGSSTDISEIVQARETIALRKEELEQLVRERTASLRKAVEEMEAFSYTVSHDLRAPVRAILGYATILQSNEAPEISEDEKKGYLARIISGATHMDRLMRDVLAFTKLGQSAIELKPVKLDPLVADCIDHFSEFSSGAASAVVVKPLHLVSGHEPLIMQAISNLLSNALKFMPAGKSPEIRISTEEKENRIRIFVEDNGIGILPEHQKRIWNMFERIHPNGTYDGTGIGLAIVKKAAERMGGSVGLESDGKSGSKFWIELGRG